MWKVLSLPLFSLFLQGGSSNEDVRFHSFYSDGMVMQRSKSGNEKVSVWGYGYVGSEDATASISCQIDNGAGWGEPGSVQQLNTNVWRADFPAATIHDKNCQIKINTPSNATLVLRNITFGDVWLCSGQSNMEQNMKDIIDAENEIESSLQYSDIKFMMVQNVLDYVEADDDADLVIDFPWTTPKDCPDCLASMSAICFLYARTVYEETGVPQGLISTSVGGSPIEAWLPQSELEKCNVPDAPDWICGFDNGDVTDIESFCNSALWNGMINPLKRNSIAGFLWYQGETNGGYGDSVEWGPYNTDIYNCTFPALIDSWRREFSTNSDTHAVAPFGFVQLANYRQDSLFASFPKIRWYQTVGHGYVPNPQQENVFMATSYDTFDSKEGYPGNLHPRYKQIVAQRLAISGLTLAYGYNYSLSGPLPTSVERFGDLVVVSYDQEISYNYESAISGFYICNEGCDDVGAMYLDHWLEVEKDYVEQISSNEVTLFLEPQTKWISYCWRETPVEEYLGLPVYGVEKFLNTSLPSPPWKQRVA